MQKKFAYLNLVLQGRVLLDEVGKQLGGEDFFLETSRGGNALTTTDETDDFFDVRAMLKYLRQKDLSEESRDSSQEQSLSSIELYDLRLRPRWS